MAPCHLLFILLFGFMSSKERGYVQLVMLMWLTGPIQDLYTSTLVWKRGLDAISGSGDISWSVQSCISFD